MSTKNSLELVASDEVCASCGTAAIDDIKLKKCGGGCNLVKYCSDNCQELHRDQHEEDCKKRLAEMRDKELFTQPNSGYMGECPICCLPLSIDMSKSTMMTCCCKYICIGCDHANQMRENEQGLKPRCAFCREPVPDSEEECIKNIMERIKKYNDPVGMTAMGKQHYREGEYEKSLKYYTKAAELGDLGAHCGLGFSYYDGEGVDMDMTKAIYHLEQAAIGGEPFSRRHLATHEAKNGRFERAAKHLIINANLGCDTSLKRIKHLFVQGVVSKEEYAAALRAHQAAVNETKSADREKAEEYG